MTLLSHGRSRGNRVSLPGRLRHLTFGSAACLKGLAFSEGRSQRCVRDRQLRARLGSPTAARSCCLGRRIPRYIFINLFWTLHKARLDWRRTRHPAYTHLSVSKTAKAIDTFELLRECRWYASSPGPKKLNLLS